MYDVRSLVKIVYCSKYTASVRRSSFYCNKREFPIYVYTVEIVIQTSLVWNYM